MTTRQNVFRSWTYCLVAIWLVSVSSARAVAQASDRYEESVQQAVIEYKAGNFEEAHALFLDAHASKPNARTWRGLGVCAFELRLYVEAAADLEAALADSRKALTPEQRAEATELLEKARAFVSTYDVRLSPDTARVEVDGKPAQLSAETLLLDPGRHVVVVRAAGYVEQRIELRTGAGVRDELVIDLVALMPRDAPEQSTKTSGVVDSSASRQVPSAQQRRPWTWSLSAGAVAATAVAVVLRLRVGVLRDDFARCRDENGEDCRPTRERGEDLQLSSRLTGALAGGLAIGAVVAFFSERASTKDKTHLSFGPRSLVLQGTF